MEGHPRAVGGHSRRHIDGSHLQEVCGGHKGVEGAAPRLLSAVAQLPHRPHQTRGPARLGRRAVRGAVRCGAVRGAVRGAVLGRREALRCLEAEQLAAVGAEEGAEGGGGGLWKEWPSVSFSGLSVVRQWLNWS